MKLNILKENKKDTVEIEMSDYMNERLNAFTKEIKKEILNVLQDPNFVDEIYFLIKNTKNEKTLIDKEKLNKDLLSFYDKFFKDKTKFEITINRVSQPSFINLDLDDDKQINIHFSAKQNHLIKFESNFLGKHNEKLSTTIYKNNSKFISVLFTNYINDKIEIKSFK